MDDKGLRKNIANGIRILRTKKRLSQLGLAVKANVSQQLVSGLKNEHIDTKLTTIVKIAEVFGVTVNDLIYEK